MRRERGFALAYAFIVSTVFLVFFAALALGFRDTVRAVRFSEDSVKCRALADLGNELVYQLFLVHGLSFIPPDLGPESAFRFSNDPNSSYFMGGPDASSAMNAEARAALAERLDPSVLGGTFTVTISDARSLGVEVPDKGTFWTMTCQARINDRTLSVQDSSRFLVKVGVPFVNYLRVGAGSFDLGEGSWSGPICAATSPLTGLPTVNIRSARTNLNFLTDLPVKNQETMELGGMIRSMGDITFFETDITAVPRTRNVAGKVPAGVYPAGSQILSESPTGGPGIGGILTTSQLIIEPWSGLSVRQDQIEEVMEDVSSAPSIEELDITSFPNGVLVEVVDSKVEVFQAELVSLGKIYDLSLGLSIFKEGRPSSANDRDGDFLEGMYGNSTAAKAAVVQEAYWDDPAWPEEAYPRLLIDEAQVFIDENDLDVSAPVLGDRGDFFDIKTVERGPKIADYNLPGGDQWTVLRMVAKELSAKGHQADTEPDVPPIVYLRGRVDGKFFLVYDLEEEAAARTADDVSANMIAILSEPSGDIPGGLRLANENVAEQPEPTAGVVESDDMVMVAARGQVRAWGLPLFYGDRVYDDVGNPLNLQELYGAGVDFSKLGGGSTAQETPVYAATVANIDTSLNSGITADARLEKPLSLDTDLEDGLMLRESARWGEIDPSGPLAPANNKLVLPTRMRLCYLNRQPRYRIVGSRSGLRPTAGSVTKAKLTYDYRWRDLSAEILGKTLGLPVGPMLIDRRGF